MSIKDKFSITPERIAAACHYVEYMNLSAGDFQTILFVSPRFVVKDGEYIMSVKHDEDGGIDSFENYTDAVLFMHGVTPQSLEKLIPEFREAAKNVVNPQRGGG